MGVGLILITHQNLGDTLLQTARSMLGDLPEDCESMAMSQNDDPDEVLARARARLGELDSGSGVLILTDMFGSTPSNVASARGAGGECPRHCRDQPADADPCAELPPSAADGAGQQGPVGRARWHPSL